MKINITDQEVTQFRSFINDNPHIYKKYKLHNGKNQWNIICSCMDWITVAIRDLQENKELSKDIDIRVMQIYSLISSIDIVYEAILQLNRIFGKNNKSKPFKGQKYIFKEKSFEKDDNDYFKELRACFGAHPVNLSFDNNTKRFASWPYNGHDHPGAIFQIQLYSNDPAVEDITVGLYTNELLLFLNTRYQYLAKITEDIKEDYNKFRLEKSLVKIPHNESMSDRINTLIHENKIRFGSDEYTQTLKEMSIIFKTELDEKELKNQETNYKENLVFLIDEIHENLQHMQLKELINKSLIYPKTVNLHKELEYELPKFITCILSETRSKDKLFNFYLDRINITTNNKYCFNSGDTNSQLLVKLKLALIESN